MRGGFLAAAGLVAGLPPGAARADDLRGALVETYRTNPTLNAQRAGVRSLDESVAIARAQARPQVSVAAGVNRDLTRIGGGKGQNLSAELNLSYPLFSGGRIRNSVRAADERVAAGRASLRGVESQVFAEAVGAYMDVIRDRSIVTLNRNQVKVLETNLQATKDQFEVGNLTRTDVAQSEARLALARSNLAAAEGRLEGSDQNYRRVIGSMPGDLDPPDPLPPLPATADLAADTALANNPDLVAIGAQARAAGYDVSVARAGRLPTLSAIGSGNYANYLGSAPAQFGSAFAPNSVASTGIGLQATIPLYQGGGAGARIRQAQANQSQVLEQGIAVERSVVANSLAAFASYRAAQAAIRSNEVAVSADTLALEGTRAEQSVGSRTILDVLNAEQELLNAQVALVTARHDEYVAGFALLAAMGKAEASDLNLDGGALYDPLLHYRQVSRRASDWSDEPAPRPVSTPTAPLSAPSATVAGPPAPPPRSGQTPP